MMPIDSAAEISSLNSVGPSDGGAENTPWKVLPANAKLSSVVSRMPIRIAPFTRR
ncbi:hypothetical protein D3C72_2168630 [compost metagenome]